MKTRVLLCDVDGYTSSAILWNYIKTIFPDADLTFTVHEHKQHGLPDKIDWLINEKQFDLVVCPDSASYDIDCHKRLKDIGTDILILDHHAQLYDNEGKPIISNFENTIIINNQLSEKYNNKTLCGAGIVYKFCQVLDYMLGKNLSREYLDLVALGLIADVMSRTTSETNYLMLEGLKNIKNDGFKSFLEAQSFSLKDKANPPYLGLTPIDVAFYIAPMINAITRVGSQREKEVMFLAFVNPNLRLQSTKRGAASGETESAAEQAARVGTNAKNRQNKLKEKALEIVDFKIQKDGLDENNIIVVELTDDDNIPQEMSGLIAMAVVTKYNKPCLIARRNEDNLLQGSMRSNNNFSDLPDLKNFLEQSNYFEYVAGHENAAGYGIEANKLDSFLRYSNTTFSEESFTNCYLVDYILKGNDSNLEKIGLSIASHPEYFGNGIDEVKVVVKDIPLTNVLVMGANKDSVKINYNNIDYIKFKDTNFIDNIDSSNTLTVYGRFNLNCWAGKISLQVFIDDYEFNRVDIFSF